MSTIPRQVWDKLCEQAKEEILQVLALHQAQTANEKQHEAFVVDLSDFILELLHDDENHFLEWYCD